jgi:hypothetical protein
VFFYEGCYICPLQILNRASGGGTVDVELATSRDGSKWDRPFRKPFWLARSTGNQFDSGSIFLCAQPVVLDDEIRFYYGAYAKGATGSDDYTFATGIGLATMARDRFAGLRTVPETGQPALGKSLRNIGQVTLKPISLAGLTNITLNADASAGAIRVELLNADGKRIRGFSYDDAVPIKSDSLRQSVRWKSRSIEKLPAENYMLRLHLENATVYALSLKR